MLSVNSERYSYSDTSLTYKVQGVSPVLSKPVSLLLFFLLLVVIECNSLYCPQATRSDKLVRTCITPFMLLGMLNRVEKMMKRYNRCIGAGLIRAAAD